MRWNLDSRRTNCLERAGHILIMCLWIEKRLVDLILLKKYPNYIPIINKTRDFPNDYTNKRLEWWQKDFHEIKETFIKNFQPKKRWRDNLEGLYYWRNVIAHGHVSLYRKYLLYRPADRVDYATMHDTLEPKEKNEAMKPPVLLLRLSDDNIYKRMLAVITEFDEKYLSFEAEQLGVVYDKLR